MQKTAYDMRISDWSSDVCSSDLLGVDRLNAAAHQVLRFRSRYARVETHIRDFIAGTVQGCDVAGQERIAFLGLHFADAIEIPEAGDVQIEVGLFVGSGHGESPENNEAETQPPQGGEGVEHPRGLMEQLGGIAIEQRWAFDRKKGVEGEGGSVRVE